MPKFYFSFLCLLLLWLSCFVGYSQQTARMTTSGYGYLEKLPYDYATNTTKKYPLLIFLHGLGERGNGSPADLQRVKAHGPPKLIETGSSMCFTVNGVEECFIVISPQLPGAYGGWYATILADIFNFILNGSQNYRIDKNRVYLTGLSLGGEGVYTGIGNSTYIPDIFAAGAPVSGFNNANGCTIVSRKVAMWGFHGTADGTITYSNGFANFDLMNWCNPPAVAELKWTSYPGLGHDIWTNYAYRTDNNLHTPNLYQWLLTKTKSSPPTANAGPDLFLTLPVNSTVVVGSGTDPGGSIASYVWTKQSGGAATLANDQTSTLNLSNLGAGVYVFRLTVTDNDGNTAFDEVTITVSSSPSLFITNPSAVCSPSTVNLTSAAITSGSTPGLTYTYWMDAAATIPYATPTAATSGTYYIKGTTSAGGSDTKPVVVVVNSIPTLVVNNPSPICAPSTVDITPPSVTSGSSGGLTFTYWTNSAATTSLTTPNSVGNGTYFIKATNGSGCFDIKPVIVSVQSQPNLIVTNPTAICSPGSINLTSPSVTAGSTSGVTFSYWTNAAGTTPLANPSLVSSSGTYYIKATNASSCFSIQPVTVTVNPAASVVIANPSAVCSPSTINLTSPLVTTGSTPGLTYTYWTDAAATSPLSNPASVSGSGTYYIKGSNVGCFDIKPVVVTVGTSPNLVTTNPAAICQPGTIDITLPAITSGSATGLTLSYWTNAAATIALSNPASITTSGTYFIKANDASVCSSIKPVTVTVNPAASVIITTPGAACLPSTIDLTSGSVTAGSTLGLTYTYWTDAAATSPLSNPVSVSGSGTYYIKGSNAGCFDIKPVVVTVGTSPNLVITNPAAICQPGTIDITLPAITSGSSTGLTFSYWTNAAATIALSNPASITTSGTYFIKANDASVCFSIKPVTVTVNPAASVIITNPNTACSPATVDLTSPAITSGSSVGLTFSYWQDAVATTPLVNPSAVTASGSYYIKGSFAACSDVKQVVVTIGSPPTLVTNNPAPICQPSSIDLTSAAITAGSTTGLNFSYWTNPAGTLSLVNPTSVTASGVYYIKGIAPNGCSDIKAVTTTINLSPIAVANPLTGSICSGQSTNIQLSTSSLIPGGVNYTWTSTLLSGNVSGHASGSGNQIVQALSSSSTGKVGYSIVPMAISSGCVGPALNAEVTVTQIPDVLINSGATSQVICNGCTTNLTLTNPNATPGTTFSWTVNTVAGTVSGATAGTGASIVQSLTKTTITGTVRYTVTPRIGSCIGTPGSIDVRINNPPTANAGTDQVIVLPINSTTLNGSGSDADGSVASYSWSKVSGPNTFTIQNAATATPALSDLVTGVYQFRLIIQDNDGAIGTDEVIITVNPKANLAPIVSAGSDISLQLPANSIDITGTATDPDGTIQSTNWKQVSGPLAVFTTSNQTIQISNLIEGTYSFQFSATDDGGKTSTDDVNVVVSPNDFRFSGLRKKFITPNGDTENEFWVLDQDTQKFATCKLTILNSDGTKVYETVGYQNDWNGTQDGKPLPQNVYYYVLDCNGVKDTGSITIIR